MSELPKRCYAQCVFNAIFSQAMFLYVLSGVSSGPLPHVRPLMCSHIWLKMMKTSTYSLDVSPQGYSPAYVHMNNIIQLTI